MSDLTEGTGPEETSAEVTEQVPGPESASNESGINPAWEPLREKLGDPNFQLIQPQLSEWDKSAQSRIESVKKQYAPYEQLGSVDEIQQKLALVKQIDESPEQIYEALGQFLRQNGRLPNDAELQEAVEDQEDEQTEDENDPRLQELAQGQEQIRQFLAEQETFKIQQQAETQLDTEIKTLEASGKYSKEDVGDILNLAAQLSAMPGADGRPQIVPLDEAAQKFDGMRQRILSTPRPGDLVPTLMPTSGGAPTAGAQKKLGDYTRQETQDTVAALLMQGKQAQ